MKKILPLEECSIHQIYCGGQETKTYMIPIYQRNYAWEEDEITTLIKDVYDSYTNDRSTPYYIGTLVTYRREDNIYEVIDGQQRLTTVYIILKVLNSSEVKNRLTYSARKVSASTIERLDEYPNLGSEVDHGIRNGYKFAEKAINEIVDKKEHTKFIDYFLHNVHMIHYLVPKDVDLNHYFEVMNSRGEQLEKHEIVKSKLSEHLKDKKELATFSHIWEACSKMNIYIQQAFHRNGIDVFGKDLHSFKIENFSKIPLQDESEDKVTILSFFEESTKEIEGDSAIEQNDKFQPIIDFPNLLLIVLKLTRMKSSNFNPTKFTLDDKELLEEFQEALRMVDDKATFAKDFAFNLLKAKFLLDNYIVHHTLSDRELSGDNPWNLQYYSQENSRKGYKNLMSSQDGQKELVHLLSMFEVSFTPKQRKNYLFYCLMYLFDNIPNSDNEFGNYLTFLQRLADKYFYDVYLNAKCLNERNQPIPNAFDNALLSDGELQVNEIGDDDTDYRIVFEKIYPKGESDIPLFVFNYTDYRLWKKYADTLKGNKTKKRSSERNDFFESLGCSDFELDSFNNFYFSRTRKSLEHFFPQAKAVDDGKASDKELSISQINCFGNFAMIGAEANSSGSNWDPKTKLDHYIDGKSDPISVASLKFKIMMQICLDNQKAMSNGKLDRINGMEWNSDDMQKHQEKMVDIIIKKREEHSGQVH